MERKILETTNPDHDRDLIADYQALYAGGKAFRGRVRRFLLQNELEPSAVYDRRCCEASYRSYVGPIVDYFAAYLVTSPFTPRAMQGEKLVENVDPFYAKLKEDCDGVGTDLDQFIRARVTDAVTARRAWWHLEKPSDGGQPPKDKAEWEARGLGAIRLHCVDPINILDWEVDEAGELLYVVTYHVSFPRRSAIEKRDRIREEWRIYDETNVTVYVSERLKDQTPSDDVPQTLQFPHGFDGVPFVCLDVGENFWILNRLADAQKEHFRLSAGLGWSIRRTCYAMPVFKVAQGDNGDYVPPKMGAGYYLLIGKEEDVSWAAPPGQVFSVVSEEIKAQKDEIYRIVHQMALGVDNNAAAVGRSGESKLADAEAIKVILTGLGDETRGALERTYQLITSARGEDYEWSIEGLDVYDDVDPVPLLEAVSTALMLDIPSPTFQREVKVRAAIALVHGADQQTKDAIRKEIADNVSDEEVRAAHENRAKLAAGEGTDQGGREDREGRKPNGQGARENRAQGDA